MDYKSTRIQGKLKDGFKEYVLPIIAIITTVFLTKLHLSNS